jgi:hypothetical protein
MFHTLFSQSITNDGAVWSLLFLALLCIIFAVVLAQDKRAALRLDRASRPVYGVVIGNTYIKF